MFHFQLNIQAQMHVQIIRMSFDLSYSNQKDHPLLQDILFIYLQIYLGATTYFLHPQSMVYIVALLFPDFVQTSILLPNNFVCGCSDKDPFSQN